MIHFKNNQAGFSFIEMMAALAIFAIVSTSIFLVHNNIFLHMIKTHQRVQLSANMQYALFELQQKIKQTLSQKKPAGQEQVTIESKIRPIITTSTLQKIKETSALYKNFYKNVYFATTIAKDKHYPNQLQEYITLEYIAELKDEHAKG